jgi:hypothetical protein
MNMDALVPQKGHGIHAVDCDMQAHGLVEVAKCLPRQPDIAGVVFNQEHFF